MLIKGERVIREPKEMAEVLRQTYKDKLDEVEIKVGEPDGDYLETLQGVPEKRGIKNFNFLTQSLGLQTVLRKVCVLKIKL